MQTLIGWAKLEFPVAQGTPLAGYEGGPPRLASGTHDPLYIRAINLLQGTRRVCIVSCDLVAVDYSLMERITQKLQKRGIAPEDFILAATHCHSGPAGIFEANGVLGALISAVSGKSDQEIIDRLESCILAAVDESGKSMYPVTLRAGAVQSPGIGTDRNDPSRPGDPMLTVLQFETEKGEQVVIYSTACHPTVLHADNTLVSADFPGASSGILEGGPVKMAMFLNGSAGDVSTRFTRKGTGFDEVERFGGLLALQVKGAMGKLPPARNDFSIISSTMQVEMKLRKAKSPAEEAENLERLKKALADAMASGADKATVRMLEARCEGAFFGLLYSQNQPKAESIFLRVHFLRVDPLLLVFFPVELFSALSNPLRSAIPGFTPVGYANGYFGYLPDKGIEHTDNYEKYTTAFAFEEGEKLMHKVASHIKEANQ